MWHVVNASDSFSFTDNNRQPFLKDANADTVVHSNKLAFFLDSLVNTDSVCVTVRYLDTILWRCTPPKDSILLDIPTAMQHGIQLRWSASAFTHQVQNINGSSYLFIREYEIKKDILLK